MQLAYNNTLGAVDDERTVLGHQRDFPEIDFLFFDVADRLCAGVRILVEDRETDDDLQRSRVGHPAFLTFGYVILQIELNGVAAFITEGDLVLVRGAAFRAQDCGFRRKWVRGYRRAAGFTSAAKVMEALEVAAFAFPVSNGVANELESGNTAEIRDWEDGVEDRLKPGIFAFLRKHVHLEKTLIGILLYLDEIGDLDRRPDL